MTENSSYEALAAHLKDLQEKSTQWHKTLSSGFLNEEEQAAMQKLFPANAWTRYDGGYEGARKKKIIFLGNEEDDFSDIVCLKARVDQRFRKISHRDVLGAVMHLQVERSSFGDLWIEENAVYLYTSESMADFFCTNLTRINQLNVRFEVIADHPSQVFHTREFRLVVAANRLDALVAGLTHQSRSKARQMVLDGLVQVNHAVLERPDHLCDNNDTISIRGTGRFVFKGAEHQTKSGRIAADFLQFI